MKLWRVFRPEPVGYDEYDGFVVWAHDEDEARRLCSLRAADEGASAWLRADRSLCLEVRQPEHGAEIVLASFNAG